ncbi:phosphate ABC transporter permease PstA [Pullulanibacillus sp. KACC 23026]|uniref:phosphate ABC transporter permease PstA n=1 Tax=Pullulanibacillus sp. KACC 23026 TaxID=3028315 RepID=UPI0023AE816B|nr:phosphate ABC transporter permease PstA [Pullulanibacillus sp. KACC 23026]WEG14264.1 phosphate ABC transporter permease PstA [Pullulanibacillus sp. KACC 23026]
MARVTDRIATIMMTLCVVLMIAILFSLLGYIFYNGLADISWHFLTTHSSSYLAGGGIVDQLWNSFYLLILTLVISTPLGVSGGIYLAEYASQGKVTAIIRTCVEVLSSLPSIVVGLFGLLIFVDLFHWGFSILAGALALTVFNLPVIVRVSEDAIRAVPQSQKEAGLALGLTKWQTIRTILLPSAFPGILTGVILSAGRIFGESAALLFTAGLSSPKLMFTDWNPSSPLSPLNPMRSAETLSVHIWAVKQQGIMPDINQIANGASAVLVIIVLIFNFGARFVGSVIHKRMSGKNSRA